MHGGELRFAPEGRIEVAGGQVPAALVDGLERLARSIPGVVVEHKGIAVALHYRAVPVLRYSAADDFGEPSMSFTMCTLWYIEALSAIGRVAEARQLFEAVLALRNHVGLLSEDLDPATGALWGNFPQTYSMVGIILAAMHLSTPWEAT